MLENLGCSARILFAARYSFTLVASIGYGDLYPRTDGGKIFCIFFTQLSGCWTNPRKMMREQTPLTWHGALHMSTPANACCISIVVLLFFVLPCVQDCLQHRRWWLHTYSLLASRGLGFRLRVPNPNADSSKARNQP